MFKIEIEEERCSHATGGPVLLEAAKLLETVEVGGSTPGSSVTGSEIIVSEILVSSEEDPWSVTESQSTVTRWSDLSFGGKLHRVIIQGVGKVAALLALLYFFVCSLDLLSSAFRLLGGRAAGAAFSNSELLQNPVAGLMIGVLATVLVQSSSTSTSITVTMVASGILSVRPAIPIIMGANIGTSVTNTIVSLAQSSNRDEFRRAFGGATVHDMFNWLTVFTLLPLEIATGYLYHLTSAIVQAMNLESRHIHSPDGVNNDLLKTITKPFTDRIVMLDKQVIEGIAVNDPKYMDERLMKVWCGYTSERRDLNSTDVSNFTDNSTDFILANITNSQNNITLIPSQKCTALFSYMDLGDSGSGVLLLILSLTLLCSCLVLLVRLLNSSLRGSVMKLVKRVVNAGSGSPVMEYLAGYVAMIVGAVMTMIVQSSSVFTSALTPLVGVGVVRLERMYPLTLGSNVGTTTTGLLAAMAADSTRLRPALQIALVHLFFNLSGILLYYPIPCTRLPISLAKVMGNTTAKYRWFAVFYVLVMFFLLPLFVFSLSLIHSYLMLSVVLLAVVIILLVSIINVLQRRKPRLLPAKLRDWSFLPQALRSLDPLDRQIRSLVSLLRHCSCCTCCHHLISEEEQLEEEKDKEIELITILTTDEKKTHHNNDDDNDDDDDDDNDIDNRYTPKAILYQNCESGYASMTTTPKNTPANTPGPTPSISRIPSFAAIHEADEEESGSSDVENLTSGNTEQNFAENGAAITPSGRLNCEGSNTSEGLIENNSNSVNVISIDPTSTNSVVASRCENEPVLIMGNSLNQNVNAVSAERSRTENRSSGRSSRRGSIHFNESANSVVLVPRMEPARQSTVQGTRARRRDPRDQELVDLAEAALYGGSSTAEVDKDGNICL